MCIANLGTTVHMDSAVAVFTDSYQRLPTATDRCWKHLRSGSHRLHSQSEHSKQKAQVPRYLNAHRHDLYLSYWQWERISITCIGPAAYVARTVVTTAYCVKVVTDGCIGHVTGLAWTCLSNSIVYWCLVKWLLMTPGQEIQRVYSFKPEPTTCPGEGASNEYATEVIVQISLDSNVVFFLAFW